MPGPQKQRFPLGGILEMGRLLLLLPESTCLTWFTVSPEMP